MMRRLKLLLVTGLVSYGQLSVLSHMLDFPFILRGGIETFLAFSVLVYALMGDTIYYADTEFEEHMGMMAGFAGTGAAWALLAVLVSRTVSWLDEDRRALERLKRGRDLRWRPVGQGKGGCGDAGGRV